jgi:hypothetical protein
MTEKNQFNESLLDKSSLDKSLVDESSVDESLVDIESDDIEGLYIPYHHPCLIIIVVILFIWNKYF